MQMRIVQECKHYRGRLHQLGRNYVRCKMRSTPDPKKLYPLNHLGAYPCITWEQAFYERSSREQAA
jgi:hypothetical protein